MPRAGVLVLCWAALLLISGGNCDMCQAVKDDVNTFLVGTPDEYIAHMKEYNQNPAIVANARALKSCVDQKLTEEDKKHVLNVLNKIYTSVLC